jgi:putative sigma-54 modulation protein
MNISYNFKNIDASDSIKDHAASRFEKLGKYLGKSNNAEIQVNLSVDRHRHMADVIVHGDRVHISAYHESEDMYSTIDMVLDKLEAQLKKVREKSKDRRKKAADASVRAEVIRYAESGEGPRQKTIIGTNTYAPKPMSVDEAAEQLETMEDDFLVFLNSEIDRINVIYRLKNDDYGLIDPGTPGIGDEPS